MFALADKNETITSVDFDSMCSNILSKYESKIQPDESLQPEHRYILRKRSHQEAFLAVAPNTTNTDSNIPNINNIEILNQAEESSLDILKINTRKQSSTVPKPLSCKCKLSR